MAKIELKGMFVSVNPAIVVGENKTLVQKVIFKVPAYTDQFGEKKGKDELWEIQVIGDNVEKHNLTTDLEDKKAILDVFINSKYITTGEGSATRDMYIINAVLHKFSLHTK